MKLDDAKRYVLETLNDHKDELAISPTLCIDIIQNKLEEDIDLLYNTVAQMDGNKIKDNIWDKWLVPLLSTTNVTTFGGKTP
jgi:hypothetical protein